MMTMVRKFLIYAGSVILATIATLFCLAFLCSINGCSRYCAKNFPCNQVATVRDSFITVINTETKLDSFYTYIPVDSTAIKAQVNCDENGKVVFKPVYYKDSKKEYELSVKNGWLLITMDKFKDSILNVVTRQNRTITEKDMQYSQVVQKLKNTGTWKWLMVPLSLLLLIILAFVLRSFIGKLGK